MTTNAFKNTRRYTAFDVEAFARDHRFQLLKVEPGYAYVDGQREEAPSYIKALIMIEKDFTDESREGFGVNLYSQFNVKLKVTPDPGNLKRLETILRRDVTFVNPEVKVYGEYQNLLSISCENFKVLGNGQAKGNE